ncbi:MAG: hypothetical protein HY961_17540, partial [Ignavibacteriae bacterium]|nr:hypothetical protein [Ignavibacteriota bacterium]
MKTLCSVLLVMMASTALRAQDPDPASIPTQTARLNFAVPDAPAFTILNFAP